MNYNISINEELAIVVEQAMKEGRYSNRSEFFRDIVRHYYVENNHFIEEISNEDNDIKIIKERKKNPKFENLESLIC